MSSFYDDASLVVIPSGYKTSKVYAEKPTDGSGDLAFTRTGDTATRVNSAGLIEKVRTQLLNQTAFSNAYWTKRGFTLNSSTATAPDGTATATQVTENNTDANPAVAVITAPIYTNPTNFSVWIKASTATTINLSTQGALAGGSISVTTSWQKFSISQTFAIAFGPHIGGFSSIAQGSGLVLYLWQPMWEFGDVATDYFANSTGSPLSVGPVANVPRLDYLGSTCPRLILEGQRSNVVTYSEQINNAAWSKLNVTVSANQAVSPDGTTSADLVYPTTTGTDRLIEQVVSATIAQTWTSSFFVKASGFSWVLVYAPNLGACWFNASTGVFGTIAAGVTATVLGQVNGYWRISFTGTIASANAYFYAGPADANGTTTATTNGTNGLLFWGCQLEQGAYSTSLIPTLAASATRGADACSKTGISSLIGQTEGVVFVEAANLFLSGSRTIALLYTSGSAFYQVYINASNQFRVDVNGSFLFLGGSIAANTNYKIAFAYKSGEYALYINGAQIATSASTTMPSSLTAYYLGNSIGSEQSGAFSQALLFKTRLTNAELAQLTTL